MSLSLIWLINWLMKRNIAQTIVFTYLQTNKITISCFTLANNQNACKSPINQYYAQYLTIFLLVTVFPSFIIWLTFKRKMITSMTSMVITLTWNLYWFQISRKGNHKEKLQTNHIFVSARLIWDLKAGLYKIYICSILIITCTICDCLARIIVAFSWMRSFSLTKHLCQLIVKYIFQCL